MAIGSPSAWAATGQQMRYGRVISDVLLAALSEDGPLHGAIRWRNDDLGLRDVQLRKEQKGPASWASLYVGLTSVLDIYERADKFRLRAHATHRAAAGFHDSWADWQTLEQLTTQWPSVERYLEHVVKTVHPRWLDTEGQVHALIASSTHTGFSVINREASISFANQSTKNDLCEKWASTMQLALTDAGVPSQWWVALGAKNFGTSPDFIAVDDDGRLLVIEAKPASAAAGITWGPAQVGFYAAMYAAWLAEAGTAARSTLQFELHQRRKLGLLPEGPNRSLADLPTVVPLLAIGPGVTSPEAWGRLAAVNGALTATPKSGDAVAPLEVWRLAANGTPRPVDLSTAATSYPTITQDDRDHSTYQDRARATAVAWKLTLPAEAQPDGPYGPAGNLYPFCLPTSEAHRNLLPEATGAVGFFGRHHLQWHRGLYHGPTNHLISSQVQCVNALFAMTTNPSLIKRAFGEELGIAEVIPIEDDGAFLTFEYNGGGRDYLGEGRSGRPLTRGANSTSTDAAFRYCTSAGRAELALVEWKYTEQYLGSKLSADRKGVRELRYRTWFEADDGPLDRDVVPYEAVFVEPLYQLVRQQLLAWRIERSDTDTAQAVRVLHIAPSSNEGYWRSLDRHTHRLVGESVRDVWQRMLREDYRDRFHSVDSARFTDEGLALTSESYRDRYRHA
jgi:hypothetical protein